VSPGVRTENRSSRTVFDVLTITSSPGARHEPSQEGDGGGEGRGDHPSPWEYRGLRTGNGAHATDPHMEQGLKVEPRAGVGRKLLILGEGRPPPRGDERRGGEGWDARADRSAMVEQSTGPRCDGDDEGARDVVNGQAGDCTVGDTPPRVHPRGWLAAVCGSDFGGRERIAGKRGCRRVG